MRQKNYFRSGRHISNYGDYSLATRRTYDDTAAKTVSIMISSDLDDLDVVRDLRSVIRFKYRTTTKILRFGVLHDSAAELQVPLTQ